MFSRENSAYGTFSVTQLQHMVYCCLRFSLSNSQYKAPKQHFTQNSFPKGVTSQKSALNVHATYRSIKELFEFLNKLSLCSARKLCRVYVQFTFNENYTHIQLHQIALLSLFIYLNISKTAFHSVAKDIKKIYVKD